MHPIRHVWYAQFSVQYKFCFGFLQGETVAWCGQCNFDISRFGCFKLFAILCNSVFYQMNTAIIFLLVKIHGIFIFSFSDSITYFYNHLCLLYNLNLKCLSYFSLPFVHNGVQVEPPPKKHFPLRISARNLHHTCIHLRQP